MRTGKRGQPVELRRLDLPAHERGSLLATHSAGQACRRLRCRAVFSAERQTEKLTNREGPEHAAETPIDETP